MTRNEAAREVNDAIRKADPYNAKTDVVRVTLRGEAFEYKFQSRACEYSPEHPQGLNPAGRRDELARWRLDLVNILLAMPKDPEAVEEAEVVEEVKPE